MSTPNSRGNSRSRGRGLYEGSWGRGRYFSDSVGPNRESPIASDRATPVPFGSQQLATSNSRSNPIRNTENRAATSPAPQAGSHGPKNPRFNNTASQTGSMRDGSGTSPAVTTTGLFGSSSFTPTTSGLFGSPASAANSTTQTASGAGANPPPQGTSTSLFGSNCASGTSSVGEISPTNGATIFTFGTSVATRATSTTEPRVVVCNNPPLQGTSSSTAATSTTAPLFGTNSTAGSPYPLFGTSSTSGANSTPGTNPAAGTTSPTKTCSTSTFCLATHTATGVTSTSATGAIVGSEPPPLNTSSVAGVNNHTKFTLPIVSSCSEDKVSGDTAFTITVPGKKVVKPFCHTKVVPKTSTLSPGQGTDDHDAAFIVTMETYWMPSTFEINLMMEMKEKSRGTKKLQDMISEWIKPGAQVPVSQVTAVTKEALINIVEKYLPIDLACLLAYNAPPISPLDWLADKEKKGKLTTSQTQECLRWLTENSDQHESEIVQIASS